MIVGFTGHRSDKLPDKETGYNLPNPTYIYVCQQLEKHLLQLKPEKAISGMALGTDQYAANVCIKLGIPFIAAIPFEGQERIWPDKSKRAYYALLSKACEKVIVSPGGFSAKKLQIRNEWIVDHCDILIAVFKTSETGGGTFNCIEYAKSKNKQIIYIDPRIDSLFL